MLERFMKINLGTSLKLDGDYTNHSIRSTVIRILDREGFEARHIIGLSSHKNESTIKDYATTCPDGKKIGPCGPELIWLYTKRKFHQF